MRFLYNRIPHLTTRHQTNNFIVESKSHFGVYDKTLTADCNQHKFWIQSGLWSNHCPSLVYIALIVNGIQVLRNRFLFKNQRIMKVIETTKSSALVIAWRFRIQASSRRFSFRRQSPLIARRRDACDGALTCSIVAFCRLLSLSLN